MQDLARNALSLTNSGKMILQDMFESCETLAKKSNHSSKIFCSQCFCSRTKRIRYFSKFRVFFKNKEKIFQSIQNQAFRVCSEKDMTDLIQQDEIK